MERNKKDSTFHIFDPEDIKELHIGDLILTPNGKVGFVRADDGITDIIIQWSWGKIERDYSWTILEDAKQAGWKILPSKSKRPSL